MADKKPSDTPIPSIAKDDPEDVSWALSTAEAMWSRGDHVEAVKWIRRAAEAASEAEADDRALALAKAAADLAAQVGPIPQTAPPPPVVMAPKPTPSAAPPPAPIARVVPPAPPSRPSAAPPPPKPAAAKVPAAPASSPSGAIAPRAPLTGTKSVAPVARAGVTPARAPTRRKSHANLTEEAKKAAKAVAIAQSEETTVTVETPTISEAPRRRARSKPAADEITPSPRAAMAAPLVPNIPAPRPAAGMPAMPPMPASPPSTDDMDQWPTQSLVGDDLDDDGGEKTRIGSPAYQEAAKRSVPPPAPVVPVETTQAIRVVVWQAADGLRVAPQGTPVSGIALDAIIVALDPATDLASWFAARKT